MVPINSQSMLFCLNTSFYILAHALCSPCLKNDLKTSCCQIIFHIIQIIVLVAEYNPTCTFLGFSVSSFPLRPALVFQVLQFAPSWPAPAPPPWWSWKACCPSPSSPHTPARQRALSARFPCARCNTQWHKWLFILEIVIGVDRPGRGVHGVPSGNLK